MQNYDSLRLGILHSGRVLILNQPITVEDYRGGTLENVHPSIVCAVNDQGKSIFKRGDVSHPTFYRSAMKPIQAIPAFRSGVIEDYGLSEREAALFTASHRGEVYHQEALASLIEKLGIDEEALICGEAYPLNRQPRHNCLWHQQPKRKLYHNCSGKHLGFLAASRAFDWGMDRYQDLNHPLQQEILRLVSELSETRVADIQSGKDGCGVPVHAVPLKNMALSYLKLACPDLIQDEATASAVGTIGRVMNGQPEIIASHQFICAALLHDDNIIAKGGAQGVYCFALRKERVSFALKVLSGSEEVWPLLVASLLEEIAYDNQATIDRLRSLRSPVIRNDSGEPVGETVVRG
ncbi:asparaginase [Tuberibacillus sp. Marseille-P3662]|uniref:asparaginase n=1 Tax=Tuberibacillus sp. Marseille-P3662 TaxID=1965358 RepID=UPI000A1C97F5